MFMLNKLSESESESTQSTFSKVLNYPDLFDFKVHILDNSKTSRIDKHMAYLYD